MPKSFTLIELIVVIAIVAILAAVIAPNAFRAIEKAKVAKLESDMRTFKTAAVGYYADIGQWPPDGVHWFTNEEIEFFISGIGQPFGWDGPYLERWPDPPWHCEFIYGGDTVQGSYDWDHWGPAHPWSFGEETCAVSVSCVPESAAWKIEERSGDDNSLTFSTGRVRWDSAYAGGFLNIVIVGGGTGIN